MKMQNLHVADIVVSEFFNHCIWTQGMSENGKNLRTHQNSNFVVNLGHPSVSGLAISGILKNSRL
jgi:hypothetical protein